MAAATLTCGADNLGTYIPLFAAQDSWAIAEIGAVFLLLTAVWCGAARWLVYHPTLGPPIRGYGHRIRPMFLIGLGFLILVRNGSFAPIP